MLQNLKRASVIFESSGIEQIAYFRGSGMKDGIDMDSLRQEVLKEMDEKMKKKTSGLCLDVKLQMSLIYNVGFS